MPSIAVMKMDGDDNFRKVLISNNGNETGVADPLVLIADPLHG